TGSWYAPPSARALPDEQCERGRFSWGLFYRMSALTAKRYNDRMSDKRPQVEAKLEKWYRGPDVPMRIIRKYAREVAELFRPEKIILFGSYAYGKPHADSDVDILVVMPARNETDAACRIDRHIDPPFPLDLIVRTPKNMSWRLAEGDSFLR